MVSTIFFLLAGAALLTTGAAITDNFSAKDPSKNDKETLRCLKNEILTYNVTMNQRLWARKQTERIVLSFNLDILCVAENYVARFNKRALKYRMRLTNLCGHLVTENGEMVQGDAGQAFRNIGDKLKTPFYFVQLENGTIAFVLKSRGEDARISNMKKALASMFQVVLTKGHQDVVEVGAGNRHTAHYDVEDTADGDRKVHKHYSSSDVERFAKGSNVEPSDVDYDEEEDLVISDGTFKFIRGRLHVELFKRKPGNDDDDDDDDDDDESYNKDSDLDGELTTDQDYTVELIGRQRIEAKRSVHVDDTHGLEVSSLETEHAEMHTFDNQRESSTFLLPALMEELKEFAEANGNYSKPHSELLQMLELEGLCELHGCPSGVDTPLTHAVIKYFETESAALRDALLPLLVASGSKDAQKVIGDTMINWAKYGLNIKTVLIYAAFLRNPSPRIVSLVTKLLEEDDCFSAAALTLGSLARNADKETSDRILNTLITRFETDDERKAANLLLAIGNTQNIKAAEELIKIIRDEDTQEELRFGAALVLNQLDENQVDALLLKELEEDPLDGTNTIAHFVLHILADRHSTDKSTKTTNLKEALATRLSHIGDDELTDFYNEHIASPHHRRSRRSSSTDWAHGDDQFDDVASRSSRLQDKRDYPAHMAYLFGAKQGNERMHARFTAGAFAGVGQTSPLRWWERRQRTIKVFAKMVGSVSAFGKAAKIFEARLELSSSGSALSYSTTATVAGRTLWNEGGRKSSCYEKKWTFGRRQLPALSLTIRLPLGTMPVTFDFTLSGQAGVKAGAGFSLCPLQSTMAKASFKPSADFTASASASANSWLFKGGIRVWSNFNFYVRPEVTLTQRSSSNANLCLALYRGNGGVAVNIAPYYQFIRGNPRTITSLTATWKGWPSSEKKVYELCRNKRY